MKHSEALIKQGALKFRNKIKNIAYKPRGSKLNDIIFQTLCFSKVSKFSALGKNAKVEFRAGLKFHQLAASDKYYSALR